MTDKWEFSYHSLILFHVHFYLSEWVWGVCYASSGVPVPEQECVNHFGGTPYTPRETFPAEEEAQECNPQSRAFTEM